MHENGSTSTLSLEQNYQSCALQEDTTEQILTGIAQTMVMGLGGALMMLEQGIVFEAEEVQTLQINEFAPDFFTGSIWARTLTKRSLRQVVVVGILLCR